MTIISLFVPFFKWILIFREYFCQKLNLLVDVGLRTRYYHYVTTGCNCECEECKSLLHSYVVQCVQGECRIFWYCSKYTKSLHSPWTHCRELHSSLLHPVYNETSEKIMLRSSSIGRF